MVETSDTLAAKENSGETRSQTLRIGVWVELPPYAQWSGEGLVRLLSFIIEHSIDENVGYVIYVPHWLYETVSRDVESWGERSKRIVTVKHRPGSLPFLLKLATSEGKHSVSPDHISILARLKRLPGNLLSSLRTQWATVDLVSLPFVLFLDVIVGLIIVAVAIPTAIVALPFLLAFLIARWALGAAKKIKVISTVLGFPAHLVREASEWIKRTTDELLPSAIQLEYRRMAKFANREPVACWFVTYPGYSNARFLNAPICLLFPDFVVGEFPTLYRGAVVDTYKDIFATLIPKAEQFVTISDHVKDKYLIGVFGAPPSRCRTIRHAPPSLAAYAPYLPRDMKKTPSSKRDAAEAIRSYCISQFEKWPVQGPLTNGIVQPYLVDFPFEFVNYVLVSTQNRPYKNTLGVIRAVQKLNRLGTNCKLIMTGDFGLDDNANEIGRYVRDHQLMLQILCIPRVPRDILAALFHCATAAVHASFYEGGIGAFPFFEGMSVGTPVLLSRNPATIELRAGPEFERFLFEPNDVDEMAAKLQDIISEPGRAFDREWPIYDELRRRTWEDASAEYIATFRQTAASANRS